MSNVVRCSTLGSTLAAGLVASVALTLGCSGSQLNGRVGAIDELIKTARANGAQKCAPVELAMAESHRDFAKQDLAEGNYFPAKKQVGIAEVNAQQAVKKSPRDKCVPKKVVVKKLVVTPKDSDGDGILDKDDACPNKPEDMDNFEDKDGCPDLDNDNDGLADKVDKCPNNPEDKDNFEDDDGCPDNDNDKDGLADKIDQCPDKPEDKDGFKDDDGCPDCDNDGDGVPECPKVVDKCPDKPAKTPDGCPQKFKLIVVTKTKIELKQTVYFAFNRARIKPVSFALLNEVATALKDNSSINVRIEGHTDSRGSARYNLKLSSARARSVRTYLVNRGVPGERMVAKGYGEAVPIADNRTEAGRRQNRRVEFVITSR